jgi:sRNA-binding carbon storage regulator CsrA
MLLLNRKIGDKIEIVVNGKTKILIDFLSCQSRCGCPEESLRFRVGITAPKNCDIYRDNIKKRKPKTARLPTEDNTELERLRTERDQLEQQRDAVMKSRDQMRELIIELQSQMIKMSRAAGLRIG